MATLIKNQGGIYHIVYHNHGKRIWRSLHTRDRNLAYARFLEGENTGPSPRDNSKDGLKPNIITNKSLSLQQAVDEYTEHVRVNFTTHTQKDYKSILKLIVNYFGADKPVVDITIRDIEHYKNEKYDRKRSPHTINHDLRYFKAFFNKLICWGILDKNPCKGIKPIRIDETIRPYLSKEELHIVLTHTEGTQLHDIILIAVLTGLRLGEIVNLTWVDILLDKRKIIVRSNGNFRTKTGKIRTIPINSSLQKILEEVPEKKGILFKGTNEKAIRTEFVSKQFKKAVRDCNLNDKLHFHSLRHTFGSYLVEQGVSLFHVQQLLGHSSPWVTQIYAHLGTNELMSSVEKLGV
jgi:site-specific recombinase XerD